MPQQNYKTGDTFNKPASKRKRSGLSLLAGLAGIALSASVLTLTGCGKSDQADVEAIEFLNVSYDPTREFYREFNAAFAAHWEKESGQRLRIDMSHGGSGRQARAVIDGIQADVVTLALAADINALAKRGLLPEDWQSRLPANSAPYQSTLAFLVRKGNPKNIQNWDDLARSDVAVITPNPKTSGVARWNYLAAWGWALRAFDGDEARVIEYMKKLYTNVPVLDTGARGSSTTFTDRRIGDVLINWENELLLAVNDRGEDFEIVVPSVSILAEPTVAWVDRNTDRRGTREIAEAYLKFLYTDIGQDLAGKHFYRPSNPVFLEKYQHQYPDLELFTIDDVFGGWASATEKHFRDGGLFDQIYLK
ncbi:MAG: sulfate ABC transporter substrate-binding protein [Opitutales bacterium]